jgi:DNA polymerase-3 subunit delta'
VSVWTRVAGQDEAVADLSRAAADAAHLAVGEPGPAMTHAWLLTGPPGSGRSLAAGAFAAALVCPSGGCGTCSACRTALTGAHPDVTLVRPEGTSLGVDEARALVGRAAEAPAAGPWTVLLLEDADRLTDQAANALLKALEEPSPRTVWVLCTPSAEDVLPTIRSRCRQVSLRTPSIAEVARILADAYGVDPAMAAFAARASQGHIGRARALASDEQARLRRQEVLRIPLSLRDLPTCFSAAADVLAAATEDARAITDALDQQEEADLRRAYGEGAEGVTPARVKKLMSRPLKDLQDAQKRRRTRVVRDQVDRALVDLLGLYRDVLAVQVGARVSLINEEMRPQVTALADQSTQADTARRLEALGRGRLALRANVATLLALEATMVSLKDPSLSACRVRRPRPRGPTRGRRPSSPAPPG